MKNRISVVIADDHFIEREGLSRLLKLANTIELVGVATSAQEAVQISLNINPQVLVLDLAWYGDGTAGISAIRKIKQEKPQIKILAMTNYPGMIESARAAGADVALTKDSLTDRATLEARIKDAYTSVGFPNATAEPKVALTERELEIMRLIAKGMTSTSMANELNISVATVKKHISNILMKLRVKNSAESVTVAYEMGILTTPQTK